MLKSAEIAADVCGVPRRLPHTGVSHVEIYTTSRTVGVPVEAQADTSRMSIFFMFLQFPSLCAPSEIP